MEAGTVFDGIAIDRLFFKGAVFLSWEDLIISNVGLRPLARFRNREMFRFLN
jgi:hypothetical protein